MVERVSPGPPLGVPALLLFASGAAGLIYQILWIKQISLIIEFKLDSKKVAGLRRAS